SLFLKVTAQRYVRLRCMSRRKIEWLLYNSRLEKGSTEKDKYGYLERENGVYYFKLNLKIGLLKR
ncbi:HpaII family restriction endonuclease, partial [Phocaeicola coprocola]|uniref:HpaII family restriction endonuclease n=1 Tax=Phocaeicola coprocola TaxID=310298 RepID=UPI0032C1D4D0